MIIGYCFPKTLNLIVPKYPNDIAPWSHVTMAIEHSVYENPFLDPIEASFLKIIFWW